MTVDAWIAAARADAERRGRAAVVPLLDILANAMRQLRRTDWHAALAGTTAGTPGAGVPEAGTAGDDGTRR